MTAWRSTSLTHAWTGWQGDFAPPPPPPPPPPPGKQHSTCSALQNHTSVSGAQVSRAIVAGDLLGVCILPRSASNERAARWSTRTATRSGAGSAWSSAVLCATPTPSATPSRSTRTVSHAQPRFTSALACQIYRRCCLSFLTHSAIVRRSADLLTQASICVPQRIGAGRA